MWEPLTLCGSHIVVFAVLLTNTDPWYCPQNCGSVLVNNAANTAMWEPLTLRGSHIVVFAVLLTNTDPWYCPQNCGSVLVNNTADTAIWEPRRVFSLKVVTCMLKRSAIFFVFGVRKRPVELDQADHLSGKPGNVREFDSCQGKLAENCSLL